MESNGPARVYQHCLEWFFKPEAFCLWNFKTVLILMVNNGLKKTKGLAIPYSKPIFHWAHTPVLAGKAND